MYNDGGDARTVDVEKDRECSKIRNGADEEN